MSFDAASLIPIVGDIIKDFGTPGKIIKIKPGDIDGTTGDIINQPEEADILFIIEDFEAQEIISGKADNGDAKVTLQTDFEILDTYLFEDETGKQWEIASTTPVVVQGLNIVYELRCRK